MEETENVSQSSFYPASLVTEIWPLLTTAACNNILGQWGVSDALLVNNLKQNKAQSAVTESTRNGVN